MIVGQFLNGRVTVKTGDLTLEEVDAIVNAANSSLMGGGGVDGAIHTRGGTEIVAECRTIIRDQYPDGLPTGEAVITTGGKLPARLVIHTVGPVYGRNGGLDAELLAACYRNSLELAASHALSSIAFASISTGVYGYPLEKAAAVSSAAIKSFAVGMREPADIRLVFFSQRAADTFMEHHQF
jgi:O-acetyl-ADP-ribose deacetylase (regulator of RNase III)